MKNTLFILFTVIICQISYSQTYSNPYTPPTQVNVTVKKEPNDFSTSFTQGLQAGAAAKQANAATQQAVASRSAVYNEALKVNYCNITFDNLINNTKNYDYIVLESVSGWQAEGNKESILSILIEAKKYEIIDLSNDYKSKGKEIENKKSLPDYLMNNPKVLFVSWLREAHGDNRISKLTIKNFEGMLIYESISKNLSYQEILIPLTSNYTFTKEKALLKVEELKKYLDLGIITKEEFDLKVDEIKPILLGEN